MMPRVSGDIKTVMPGTGNYQLLKKDRAGIQNMRCNPSKRIRHFHKRDQAKA